MRAMFRTHARELEQAAPAVASYLADWRDYVRGLVRDLEGVRHLFLVGRGASLAAVGTGALIVKKTDHFHAEGIKQCGFPAWPSGDVKRRTFVLVFSGDARTQGLNGRLLADLQTAGQLRPS